MDVVVDASALGKAFLEEPSHAAYRSWEQEIRDEGLDPGGPHLLFYELGNLVQREYGSDPPDHRARIVDEALRGIQLETPSTTGIAEAAAPVTFYDAAYLALAREHDAPLVTYDDVLAEAAEERGVEVLSP